MDALVLERREAPDAEGHVYALQLRRVPKPSPAAGEGLYPRIKAGSILGSDGAGVVERVGSTGDGAWVGRRVVIDAGVGWGDCPAAPVESFGILGMLPLPGTFADYVCVSVAQLHDIPPHLTMEEAATLPVAGLTAFRAVFTKGMVPIPIKAPYNGQTKACPAKTGSASREECADGRCGATRAPRVLVTGIGGGVALLATQLAVAAGAPVHVTSSSDDKIGRAKALGAAGGVNYRKDGWEKDACRAAGGLFDVIVDGSGGESMGAYVRMVGLGGRIVTYGATAGFSPQVDVPRLFLKNAEIRGSTMGHPGEFAHMMALIGARKVRPVVACTVPLREYETAFAALRKSEQFGKIVLAIAPDPTRAHH